MRLRDYYRGLKLRLATALPPAEVERRINDVTASPLRPFATGVVGYANAGRLALRYRPGFVAYRGMPMLTGSISARGGGSLLDLNYRGRAAARAVFPVAYGAIAAMLLAWAIWGQWDPSFGPSQKALLIALLVTVPNLPLLIHMIAIRSGEAHLARLAAFLRSELDATEIEERDA